MYRLNTALWLKLPELLGLRKMDFYSAINTTAVPYFNVINHEDIRLSWLVSICNQFHISIRHFIIEEGTEEIPEMLTVPAVMWIPIVMRMDQLYLCYRQRIGGCVRKDFYEEIDYSPTNFGKYVWHADEPTIMSSALLRVCNRWGFSPWKVIWDDNQTPTPRELLGMIRGLEKRIEVLEGSRKS